MNQETEERIDNAVDKATETLEELVENGVNWLYNLWKEKTNDTDQNSRS